LRKIFGPVQNEDGSWRIKMNCELNELIGNADIVRSIKSRIACLGHVMRMADKRTPKRILQWKPIGTRIRGRPRKRRIAGIEEDLQNNGSKTVEKAIVKKGHNGRISLRRLKSTVGCNASKRRSRG
jgi:hypothetical protein